MYMANEYLGWSYETFLNSTPRFFQEMLIAKRKHIKEVNASNEANSKPKTVVYEYLDEIPDKLKR